MRLNLPKVGEVGKILVEALNIDVLSHFLKGAEHFQLVGVHWRVARTIAEITVELLEASERLIENGEGAFDNGAVLEGVYVP